jgi:chromosomal replication initiation ATPase DnaA
MHSPVAGIAPPSLERAVARLRPKLADTKRLLAYLKQQQPTLAEIVECVCEFYDLMGGEIRAGTRAREVVFARQMFCYLAYRYTRHTLPVIASRVGYRDHSTAHHGVRTIEKSRLTMPLVRDDIDVLRLRIAEKILQRGGGTC